MASLGHSHSACAKTSGGRAPGAGSVVVGGRVVEVEPGGPEGAHHRVEDPELEGGEGADHDATGAEACEAEVLEAGVLGDLDQALGDGPLASRPRLVDLREQRVCRVGDDGRGNTRNDAGGEGHSDIGDGTALLRGGAEGVVDDLCGLALHGEFCHGVGDLLEQDGPEPGVEGRDGPHVLRHLRHRGDSAVGVCWVGDLADAGGLQRAQEDVRNELRRRRGSEIDVVPVVPRALRAEGSGDLDLEELHPAELEPSLHEVPHSGGAEAGSQALHPLLLNDLLEAADHAAVVGGGVQLDAGLDDVHRAHRPVGHAAADAAGQGALEVMVHPVLVLRCHRMG